MTERQNGPAKDLTGPLFVLFGLAHEPQSANAVTVTVPPPVTVTTAVPVHAVPPAFGAEDDTAPLAVAP